MWHGPKIRMYSAPLHFPFSSVWHPTYSFSTSALERACGLLLLFFFLVFPLCLQGFVLVDLDRGVEASWKPVSWFLPKIWELGGGGGTQSRSSRRVEDLWRWSPRRQLFGLRRRGLARMLMHDRQKTHKKGKWKTKNREQDKLCTQNKIWQLEPAK